MIAAILLSLTLASSDTTCARDLDATASMVRHDYAGFSSLSPDRLSALSALEDTLRAGAQRAGTAESCTSDISRFVRFFDDGHLFLLGDAAVQQGSSPPRAAARRTAVTFLDDSTAYLTLPDFESPKPIDSVLAATATRLAATPNLIIDVRGNGGGTDNSFASVMRMLYTDSIARPGVEALSSAANVEELRSRVASMQDGARRRAADSVIRVLEGHPGEFVLMSPARKYGYNSVYTMPRRVIVISGHACASSCEQFVLDAEQSRKVTVVGAQNTYGLLDYSNVRTTTLPSGLRRVGIPMMRIQRARAMNNIGVAPDVIIPPSDSANALRFARAYLRSHPRSARADSAVAQPDPLLDRLVGQWVLRGRMAGHDVVHDVAAHWALDHEYVELHEISRERTAQGTLAYEAIVYIGRHPKTHEYAALWMDNTAYGAFVPAGTGHAMALDDSIPFTFADSTGINFRNTFVYDRAADSWEWHMDNVDAKGDHPFARVRLTRARSAAARRRK